MNLIVLTDGADTSRRLLPHAAALGRAVGGRINLVRVMDPAAEVQGQGRTPEGRREKEEGLIGRWESSMREEMDQLGVSGSVHAGMLRQGESVADAALRNALDSGASLIVMGSRGGSSIREILFGSVAREVLKKARQPVMLVGPACKGPTVGEGYRVVVAVDRPSTGHHLVGVLGPVFHAGGVDVIFLSVHVPTLGDEGERAEVRTLEKHLRELQLLLPPPVRSHVLVRTLHGAKSLKAEMRDTASEVSANAIALLTKTYGKPGEPLVRSAARHTIQSSPVPVILVPPKA